MADFSAVDSAHMARALKLAARGRYTARPNPMVGCVLVRDGVVIGEGWHQRAGEAHAEILALASAGDASGSTAYVTLEPCVHHGKTPPCADALIDAQVAEVVIAGKDPFGEVNGRGATKLEAAGITVRCGLMRAVAESLNRGFLSRIRQGRPFVRLKMATSIDGAVAMSSGESQWISGAESRADVQRMHAESGAILSDIGTVLADDPSFTVREEGIAFDSGQPLRAILDSRLRMPLSSGMLSLPGRTVVYCIDDADRKQLENAGAEVVRVAALDGRPDIQAVLGDLGDREINDLLVEAGPELAGSLLEQEAIDELVIYQAPHIMGSETVPMFQTPGWTELASRRSLEITDVRRVGPDTRITARPGD